MSATGIKCAACGHVTTVGRKFCVQCGTELDLKNLVTVRAPGARSGPLRIVRLVIFLALLVGLAQLLRAVPAEGQAGDETSAARFEQRLLHLQSGAINGERAEETFPESELNGYLSVLLKNSPSTFSQSFIKAELVDLRAQLLPNTVVVVWTAKLGALPLSYEAVYIPVQSTDGVRLERARVRMGHLPLPGVLGDWTSTRLLRMFDNLKAEQQVLASLTDVQVGVGGARAQTGTTGRE